MPSTRLVRIGTLAAACALCVQHAPAAETSGYALTLERDSSALRIDDAAVATIRERVGITFEETYPSRTVLELTLGQVFLTQSRFPTAGGIDATGYFLRVAGYQPLIASRPFRAVIHGRYQFEQVDGAEPDADSVRLHSFKTGIALYGAPAPWISVGARGDYGLVSGVEKTAQPAYARRDVEGDARFGAQVMLDLNVEPGGYVGISAGTGINRGFALYFARRLSN